MLSPTSVQQNTLRNPSQSTPFVIDVAVGTGSTAIYTGKSDRSFLIRGLMAVNTTGGAITLTVTVDGNTWYAASVAANATGRITELEGLLLDPSVDITATGSATGVRLAGWGVRIFGGDSWAL